MYEKSKFIGKKLLSKANFTIHSMKYVSLLIQTKKFFLHELLKQMSVEYLFENSRRKGESLYKGMVFKVNVFVITTHLNLDFFVGEKSLI